MAVESNLVVVFLFFCSTLVGKLGKQWVLGHHVHVASPTVWHHTVGAILDSTTIGLLDIDKVAAAFVCQSIERAVTKQAVEVIGIVCFVARKVLAITVLKK